MAQTEDKTEKALDRKFQEFLENEGVSLNDVLAAFGVDDAEIVEHETRAARIRRWKKPGAILKGEEREIIQRLPETVGSAPIPDEPRLLTEEELVAWARELKDIRASNDIMTGRHEAARLVLFDHMTEAADGDEFAPMEVVVADEDYKFVRQIRQGAPSIDMKKLKERVDHDTWLAMTDQVVTRVFNPSKAVKLMARGKISRRLLKDITVQGKKTPAFVPGPIKD